LGVKRVALWKAQEGSRASSQARIREIGEEACVLQDVRLERLLRQRPVRECQDEGVRQLRVPDRGALLPHAYGETK
jgi:hypothetical protein